MLPGEYQNRYIMHDQYQVIMIKGADTRENQQSGCAPSSDSDQPGHPPSLIRFFAVRTEVA